MDSKEMCGRYRVVFKDQDEDEEPEEQIRTRLLWSKVLKDTVKMRRDTIQRAARTRESDKKNGKHNFLTRQKTIVRTAGVGGATGIRVLKGEKEEDNYIWIRGSHRLNKLSQTRAFEMSVFRGQSLEYVCKSFKAIEDTGKRGWFNLRQFKTYLCKKAPHLFPQGASMFNTLDRKRVGRITFEELMKKLFPTVSSEELQILIQLAEPDKPAFEKVIDEETKEEVEEIFRIYDDDKDDMLDIDEFMSAMEICGYTDDEAYNIFEEIDADNSGTVTLDEFLEWYVTIKDESTREHSAAESFASDLWNVFYDQRTQGSS